MKSTLAEKTVLGYIMVPPYLEIIGHGFLQTERGKCRDKHCLCYQICLILNDVELVDAINFVKGISLTIVSDCKVKGAVEVQEEL